MQKTLGGDRLGAGKKMKVELHNYERSTHDVGYVWRSTMAAGTLVPFMSEVALPGSTWDINLQCDVKTLPTIGPLFGSYKVQLDTFIAPIRLYNAQLHNNTLGVGRNMSQIKLPVIRMTALPTPIGETADIDNAQVNPSSLLAYVGIRGVGRTPDVIEGLNTTRDFNAVPILMYWETVKNYYANKQEEIGAVIHTPQEAMVETVDTITINGQPLVESPLTTDIALPAGGGTQINFTGTQPILSQLILVHTGGETAFSEIFENVILSSPGVLSATYNGFRGTLQTRAWRYRTATDINTVEPQVVTFPLDNIDDMRKAVLNTWSTTALVIHGTGLTPYTWLSEQPNGRPNVLSSQEGLAVKTYQSDLFNNWLKTENIEAISASTAIDTSGGSFTIDTLVISRKVWNMLQRINVSGGSYDDWMDAVYVHERYRSQESPMYMGGLIKELVFQEVVSNSESLSGQPLGTLAGKGELSGKHKGGNVVIHVDEPSYIMGIVSLTPRIDYSQGNKWDMHLKTMDDFHKPALDEIGFQELIVEQMAWWDTNLTGGAGAETWEQHSAGKQPAWLNYMTNVNRTYGNFAIQTEEMFMTLNRRYEENGSGLVSDLTTYIDPAKYNFIFAETKRDAQNFWVQIGVNITARKKMSAKLMPNL